MRRLLPQLDEEMEVLVRLINVYVSLFKVEMCALYIKDL